MFLVRIIHRVTDRISLSPATTAPNLFVEDLTPSVTAFGDRIYNEVIKVKQGHQGRVWSNRIGFLINEHNGVLTFFSPAAKRGHSEEISLQAGKSSNQKLILASRAVKKSISIA